MKGNHIAMEKPYIWHFMLPAFKALTLDLLLWKESPSCLLCNWKENVDGVFNDHRNEGHLSACKDSAGLRASSRPFWTNIQCHLSLKVGLRGQVPIIYCLGCQTLFSVILQTDSKTITVVICGWEYSAEECEKPRPSRRAPRHFSGRFTWDREQADGGHDW